MARTTSGRTSVALSIAVAALLAAQFIPDAPMPQPSAKVQPPPSAAAAKPAPQALRIIALPPPPAPQAPAPSSQVVPLRVQAEPPPAPPPPAIKPLKVTPPEAVKVKPSPLAGRKPLTPEPEKKAEPVETPTPRPVKTVAAKAKADKPLPVRATRPTPQATATGRVLLRVLEHGKGPAIEIAWPAGGSERRRLADLMRRCYGMELALMDGQGRLYADQGAQGKAWRPNLDLYSGFVRHISGGLQAGERQTASRIRRRHSQTGSPVRIYPRRVDSLLLGGLRQIIGSSYSSAASIQATYRIEGHNVIVGGIGVDGRGRVGAVNLSAAAHCGGA